MLGKEKKQQSDHVLRWLRFPAVPLEQHQGRRRRRDLVFRLADELEDHWEE